MYKLTIEEVVGEIRKLTTLETDDVELVKLLLLKEERIYVESDVPNLNIDPEWQELMQWYKEQREKEAKKLSDETELMEAFRKIREEQKRKGASPLPTPLNPWPPYDPNLPWGTPGSPFVVTC